MTRDQDNLEKMSGHYREWYEYHNTPEKMEAREAERRRRHQRRQSNRWGLTLLFCLLAVFGIVIYWSITGQLGVGY